MAFEEGKKVFHTIWGKESRRKDIEPIDFLCELIDNSIVAWRKNGEIQNLDIQITLPKLVAPKNRVDNWFYYTDNIIGLSANEKDLFGPHGALNMQVAANYNADAKKRQETKSKFGVGLKDFCFNIGRKVLIKTINSKSEPVFYQIEILNNNSKESFSSWHTIDIKNIKDQWGNILDNNIPKFFLCIEMHPSAKEKEEYALYGLDSKGNLDHTKIQKEIYDKWLYTLFFKYYREILSGKINIFINGQEDTTLKFGKQKVLELHNELFVSTKNIKIEHLNKVINEFKKSIGNNIESDASHLLQASKISPKYHKLSDVIKTGIKEGKIEFITKFSVDENDVNERDVELRHKIISLSKSNSDIGGIHIFQNKRGLVSYPQPFNNKSTNFKWLEYPKIKTLKKFEYEKNTGTGSMSGNIYWEIEMSEYDEFLFEPNTNKTALNDKAQRILGDHLKNIFDKQNLKWGFAVLTYLSNNIKKLQSENFEIKKPKTKPSAPLKITPTIQKQHKKKIDLISKENITNSNYLKKDLIHYYIVDDKYVRFQKLKSSEKTKLILETFSLEQESDLYDFNADYTEIVDAIRKDINPNKRFQFEGLIINSNSPIFKEKDIKTPDRLLILVIFGQIIREYEDSTEIINNINKVFN